MDLKDWACEYVNELTQDECVQRFMYLKDFITKEFKKEIVTFKNAEAKYLESKERPEYYSNPEEIQKKFVDAKKALYEKEEVYEYFQLERKIQKIIDEDLNEIKSAISNKFVLENKI